ncbi:MAG: lysylphosphatidylglycerol synthase transmembrane domain-containing protein [Gemmataceae bacterium]
MASHKGWIKGVVLYSVGFGLLAFLIWKNWAPNPETKSPGLQGLLQQKPDWLAVAGVIVLCALSVGIQFFRWYVLVRAADLTFTSRNAFRLGLVGYFYSQFLPGSIAGDVIKAIFIAKDQPGRKAVAVATVLIDRFFGLFGFLLLSALVGGGLWLSGDSRIGDNAFLKKVILFALATVGCALAGWVFMGILSDHLANRIAAKLHRLPVVGKSFAEIWFAIRLYRQRPKAVLICILISAISHFFMVMTFHVSVRVFPTLAADSASLTEHFIICPIGFISQVFFPAPGGVGGAEAIFGYLYGAIGRDDSTGLIGRLTFRMGEYAIGFLGYLVFLSMKKELPAPEESAPKTHISSDNK